MLFPSFMVCPIITLLSISFFADGDKSFIAHCAAIKTMNFSKSIIQKAEVVHEDDADMGCKLKY